MKKIIITILISIGTFFSIAADDSLNLVADCNTPSSPYFIPLSFSSNGSSDGCIESNGYSVEWFNATRGNSTDPGSYSTNPYVSTTSSCVWQGQNLPNLPYHHTCTKGAEVSLQFITGSFGTSKSVVTQNFTFDGTQWAPSGCTLANGQPCTADYFSANNVPCPGGFSGTNCFGFSGSAVPTGTASSSSSAVKSPTQKAAMAAKAPMQKSAKSLKR